MTQPETTPVRSYGMRLGMAFLAGFVLVALTVFASGGHRQDMSWLLGNMLLVGAIALPSAVVAAFLVRRDLAVVLAGQLMTIAGMFALRWLL